jgi:hypothetical protein
LRTVLWVALLNDGLAWFGAIGLATGRLSLGEDLERRLPWHSPVVAGVALGVAVAVPMSLLALLAGACDRRTGRWAVTCGALLVAWIALQVAVLRTFSPFQPTYALIGSWLVALGLHLDAPTRRARTAARLLRLP